MKTRHADVVHLSSRSPHLCSSHTWIFSPHLNSETSPNKRRNSTMGKNKEITIEEIKSETNEKRH